jgi:hypothetical protein
VNASLVGPWALRAVWAALPVTLGPALGAALDPHSPAVARTGATLGWALWAAGLLAVVIPRAVGLTFVRSAAPAALGAAVWAAADGAGDGAAIGAVVVGAVLVLIAFAPVIGDWYVDASSYGDERRMPLRVPGALVWGPLPLTWAVVVVPIVAGPLLLAAEQWVWGGIVLAAGVPLVRFGARALHSLARRFVVFVPAGVVLHDHQAMLDAVLFPRRMVARLGPSAVREAGEAEPTDLTHGSFGLALELDLLEPLQVAPRTGRDAPQVVDVTAIRFTPTRPGAFLAEARARKLPVG